MSLSTGIERTNRGPNLEKRCWSNQAGTLFGNWVRSGAIDLGFRSVLYEWKAET